MSIYGVKLRNMNHMWTYGIILHNINNMWKYEITLHTFFPCENTRAYNAQYRLLRRHIKM